MLTAIIAGIITLVVIVVVVVLVLSRRDASQKHHVQASHSLNSIDTFGVAPTAQKSRFGSTPPPRVSSGHGATGNASEMLSSRFVAMGVLAAAIFGSLAAKLWSMQILQAASYTKQAQENLYTTVYTPAPRGIIYDSNGVALVRNRSVFTILASASVAEDHDVCQRLSALLGIPYEIIRQRILDTTGGAQNTRIVQSGASLRNIAFINEHIDAFPNVTTETRTTREYPWGALAAHVLGYTGTASDTDLANVSNGRTVESGDIVGQSGIEATYEDLLAGDHGTRTVVTDADGTVQKIVSETDPTRGNDIYLTIRGPVQKIADQTMRDTVAPNGALGANKGTAAALVCLDVRDGGIIAMSNVPTYDPETFIGGISTDTWDAFNTEASHYPLMNRCIAGTYPAASTFKGFTAMAGLSKGIITKDTYTTCTGTWTGFGADFPQKCWDTNGHGTLNVVGALAHSCDVYFYEMAKGFYNAQDTLGADAMQKYIMTFGLGSQMGIDLSGEASGRIPTPEWKAEYYKDAPEQATWQGGDMSNMSIGQGYVLITPLQLACGYAGLATGKVYRPHLLKEVRNSLGKTVLSYQPEVIHEPDMSSENLDTVHEGLKTVMTLNGYDTKFFNDIDYVVAGKTGTAEVAGKNDYAWFVCYAPADNPRYACACITEEGIADSENSMPMVATVIKAAMAYDEGTLDTTMASISAAYTSYSSSSTTTTTTSRTD